MWPSKLQCELVRRAVGGMGVLLTVNVGVRVGVNVAKAVVVGVDVAV